jgi:hypothetical protein
MKSIIHFLYCITIYPIILFFRVKMIRVNAIFAAIGGFVRGAVRAIRNRKK